MQADVEVAGARVRRGSDADSTALTMRYRMEVQPHPQGRRIAFSDVSVDQAGLDAFTGALLSVQVAGLQPDLVVSPDGTLLDLVDTDGLRERLRTAMAPFADSLIEASPGFRTFIEQILTDEVLLASADQFWGPLVGFWVDGDLEVGAVYEVDSVLPVPIAPGATVPAVITFGAEARPPCYAEGGEVQCVVLYADTEPDLGAMADLLATFLRDLAPAGTPLPAFEDMRTSSHVTLVAEPGTLRPFELVVERRIEIEGVGPTGAVEYTSRYDVKRYTFRYRE